MIKKQTIHLVLMILLVTVVARCDSNVAHNNGEDSEPSDVLVGKLAVTLELSPFTYTTVLADMPRAWARTSKIQTLTSQSGLARFGSDANELFYVNMTYGEGLGDFRALRYIDLETDLDTLLLKAEAPPLESELMPEMYHFTRLENSDELLFSLDVTHHGFNPRIFKYEMGTGTMSELRPGEDWLFAGLTEENHVVALRPENQSQEHLIGVISQEGDLVRTIPINGIPGGAHVLTARYSGTLDRIALNYRVDGSIRSLVAIHDMTDSPVSIVTDSLGGFNEWNPVWGPDSTLFLLRGWASENGFRGERITAIDLETGKETDVYSRQGIASIEAHSIWFFDYHPGR